MWCDCLFKATQRSKNRLSYRFGKNDAAQDPFPKKGSVSLDGNTSPTVTGISSLTRGWQLPSVLNSCGLQLARPPNLRLTLTVSY